MKKIIFTTALAFITLNKINAQNQLSYGFRAGFNGGFITSDPKIKDAGLLPTIHLGAFGEYSFNESISIQPSLLFSGRGTSIEHKDHHDDLVIFNLDVPVQAIYRNNGFFAGGGMVLGYAISGHVHLHDSLGKEMEQELTFGSSASDYKRLNYGITAMGGYEFSNGFFFTGGIIYNLNNWRNGNTLNQKFHVFQLGVGYRIKGK